MISPAKLKAAAYIGIVLVIFFAGFKANGYLWSARYDKLEASHEKALADQRQRLLSRQEQINDETEQRETELLRELEIQREQYDLLEATINTTPLVIERPVEVPVEGECPVCVVPDWSEFGRLFDESALAGSAAATERADGGDATGEDGAADSR